MDPLPWPLPEHPALRDRLLVAWTDPERGYHDVRHLAEVLDRLDRLLDEGLEVDRRLLQLAAWFHDAVYAGAADDEERSAELAERELAAAGLPGAEVEEVARLVRLTHDHAPADGDAAGEALCDADLAILAAEPGRYAEYVAGVRRDYAHVSDPDFVRGRAAVLRDLLARVRLFRTAAGHRLWEEPARRNLRGELSGLDSSLR